MHCFFFFFSFLFYITGRKWHLRGKQIAKQKTEIAASFKGVISELKHWRNWQTNPLIWTSHWTMQPQASGA